MCACVRSCVRACVWERETERTSERESDSALLLLNWPHSAQTSRWQNKQRLDKREAMVRLLLWKQCLDMWQTAIIKPIYSSIEPSISITIQLPVDHPTVHKSSTSSINLGATWSFTGSYLSNFIILTICNVHMVQWLGVLFCNLNSLKPSISIHAKTNLMLATPRLLAPAVLHCEHIVERKFPSGSWIKYINSKKWIKREKMPLAKIDCGFLK